jgi:spore coat protein U-like protein
VTRAMLWAGLLALAVPAHADNVCRLTNVGSVAFGVYDQVSGNHTDSLQTISVTCDRDGGPQFITVDVGLGAGLHGASVAARRLQGASGSDYLRYGLFSNPGRDVVWGAASGINTVRQSLSVPNKASASTTFTVYGRIDRGQDVPAGSYTDSVQVTLTP